MIGKLNQRVILRACTETNAGGQLVKNYTDVARVWAEVISLRGTKALEAARINARETIRLRLRYRPDVDSDWQVEWEGQNYNVLYTDRSERRAGWLWVQAECVGAGRGGIFMNYDSTYYVMLGENYVMNDGKFVVVSLLEKPVVSGDALVYSGIYQVTSL